MQGNNIEGAADRIPCQRSRCIWLERGGFAVAKSSVSRDFVRAAAAQVKALAERRFDGTHFPVIMIDGVEYADEMMIVALGITADGTKRILGLRQGATENAAVCVALLEDLQARGLDTSRPVLLVLDGAKALHAAARRVWGQSFRYFAVHNMNVDTGGESTLALGSRG